MFQLVSLSFGVEGGVGALQRGDTHCPPVVGQGLLGTVSLLLTEGGGCAGDLGPEEAVGELLDLLYLVFLGHQEAEVGVLLPELLQLDCNRSDAELLLQFAAAVLEGLVMQEDDVGPGELLPGLPRYAHVEVLVQ